MSSPSSSGSSTGLGLALAGVLIFLGGFLHPRADTRGDFDSTFAGLFADPAWTLSHAVTLIGFFVLAAALVLLVRSGALASGRRLRTAGVVAAAGAVLAAVEMVPHLLAASEAEEFVRGGDTPIVDVHVVLQAVANPALGLGVAALALAGARTRAVGNPLTAVFGVIGGVAFALAGPAMLIFRDPSFAPLFIGAQGIAVWLVASGIVLARRARPRSMVDPATATS